MFTNHWSVSMGSTITPVRPERGTLSLCGFSDTSSPCALQVGEHALARLEAVQAAVGRRRVVVDLRVQRQDADRRQVVPLPDLVVVEVVRRRDLDAAGAEFRIDVVVGDHRDACGR